MTGQPNPRVAAARVDALFIDRWSPRSFSPEPLTAADIASMFEAARWSPSSSNVQPWLFLYETDGPDRAVFDAVLNPRNREWASKAPFLGFLFAATRTEDGRELRTAQFDAGAAWMSLALQAHLLGIRTHAMAGIDRDAAHAKLGVDAGRYAVMCAFAAGRSAPPDALPPALRERERPKDDRRPLGDIAHRGVLAPPVESGAADEGGVPNGSRTAGE